MADDAAQMVVRALEDTSASVAMQRQRVYAALVSAGVDVNALVRIERAAKLAELEAKAKAKPSTALAKMIASVRNRLPAPITRTRPLQTVPMPKGGMIATSEKVRTGWVIDQCQHVLTGEEYAAADRLRRAFEMTIGRDGASFGDASGSRYVALMPIQDHAISTWRAIWTRLDPASRCIVWNFVVMQPLAGHKAPLSIDEFGMLFGATKDKRRARGVVDGALKVALSSVADLLRLYDAWKTEQGQTVARPLIQEQQKRIAGPKPWRAPSGPITDRSWLEDMRKRDG